MLRLTWVLQRPDMFISILVLASLGVCALIWFRNRTRTRRARIRIIILVLAGMLALILWWFKAGWDKWNILISVGTLLAVIVALFLDDIRAFLHFPEIELYVGDDLIDEANDLDGAFSAKWVRGRIKNIGDRGVERCRLKLLAVEGQKLPPEVRKVKNGFLQWEGGIRDSMRLNPGEYWIFDIGTRRSDLNSDLRLWAHFVTDAPPINCNLRARGTYTLTLAVYGDNIQSREYTVRVSIGKNAEDISISTANR
jgi:hypothetical protein